MTITTELVDNILQDNNAEAMQNFADIMGAKVTDALDARKVEIAQNLGANHGQVQAD
jgi:mannose/fructose/N-acetylgalactosamine-specific phosphotransferase system component IID